MLIIIKWKGNRLVKANDGLSCWPREKCTFLSNAGVKDWNGVNKFIFRYFSILLAGKAIFIAPVRIRYNHSYLKRLDRASSVKRQTENEANSKRAPPLLDFP